ncbi:ImmA/IrrE family metallo-endopeptidase [Streptomyces sp. NPDC060188]|uniref:ImmA/IrrE family metallo-endopeptidase n=1 Tax=Streptomyces sp. NPDC060188 TaxID=3347068 RepID=UPI003657D36F
MARGEAEARSLLAACGLNDLPVDPEPVAVKLGASVIRQPGPAELSGMLLRRDGQAVIGLNDTLPPTRQRFVLAHLAGHLHLHRQRDLLLDTVERHALGNLSSLPTDREETEANRFALELLAPETAVRRAAVEADFRTVAQLVDLLAPRFDLTPSTMAARLMGLGIILDV